MKKSIKNYLHGGINQTLWMLSFFPSQQIRLFVLRWIFQAKIGPHSVIYRGFEIRSPWKLVIDGNSIVGHNAVLDARGGLVIGEHVNISSDVMIWTAQHDWECPDFETITSRVEIRNHAWLGPRCIILPGITIGDGAVVAAGAVVTKDVEPYTLVGGVPAKEIGKRPRNLSYTLDGSYIPFI